MNENERKELNNLLKKFNCSKDFVESEIIEDKIKDFLVEKRNDLEKLEGIKEFLLSSWAKYSDIIKIVERMISRRFLCEYVNVNM